MPSFLVPLHESNDCHEPAGSPEGGQFCSGGDRGDLSLARPGLLLGLDTHRVTTEAVLQYLEKYGREYTWTEPPNGTPEGQPNDCYVNATHLVMDNHLMGDGSLTYTEGIAYPAGAVGMGVLHGWATTPDGAVIDNTPGFGPGAKYFGVAYPQKEYAAFIVRSGTFGVLGGDDKASEKFLTSKGIDPHAMDPVFAEFMRQKRASQGK